MKDIYWKKLSLLKKIVFSIGTLGIFNLTFWVAFLILYSSKNKERKYNKFFNPHTLKVVYVFGWVNIGGIIGGLIYNIILKNL